MKDYWGLVCENAPEEMRKGLDAKWKDFWKKSEDSMRISEEAFPLSDKDLTEGWRDWLFADENRAQETTRRINQFV